MNLAWLVRVLRAQRILTIKLVKPKKELEWRLLIGKMSKSSVVSEHCAVL